MSKYIVCPRCEGEGTHCHPALSVLTYEDMRDWDEEDHENFRNGGYDVLCEMCRGMRVVDRDEVEAYNIMAEDAATGAREDGDWESYSYWRARRGYSF